MTIAAPLLMLGAMMAPPPGAPSGGPAWAIVTRAPAFRWDGIKLEFGYLNEPVPGSRATLFYVRKTTTGARSVRLAWADSLTCPELDGVVAGLLAFPAPPHVAEGSSSANGRAGMRYTLARTLRPSLFGEVDSTLARWTDRSLQRLATCWRSEISA